MIRTGVDIIEIERVRRAVERHGERFLQRIYTADELAYCGGRMESLAVRFAAKEAAVKALGTGSWRANVCWTDVEVVREASSGAPALALHNSAYDHAQALALAEWSLSLSHSRDYAVAFVVALGKRS